MVRPLETLFRTRPPIFVSWIRRTNLRYSRVRMWGDSPWKAMKMSCAISSRAVMFLIQRRTVGEALIDAGFGGGLRTAGSAARVQIRRRPRKRDRTTVSVYRLRGSADPKFACHARARASRRLCEPAGLRRGARLVRRFTQ